MMDIQSEARMERAKTIIPAFLNSESYDYEELSRELNFSYNSLLHYLKNTDLIVYIFGTEVANLVQQKKQICDKLIQEKRQREREQRKKEREEKKAKKIDRFLNDYANSRYSFSELRDKYELSQFSSLVSMLNEYERIMGNPINNELQEKIQKRFQESSKYYTTKTGELYFIKEPELVRLLLPNKTKISALERKTLLTVDCFLKRRGSIKKVIEETEKNYNAIYTELTSSTLKELIKPEFLEQVNYYIRIENVLTGNQISLKEKKEFFQQLLAIFIDQRFSIEDTASSLALDDISLCRLLKDPYINILLKGEKSLAMIKEAVQKYEESIEEDKENRK